MRLAHPSTFVGLAMGFFLGLVPSILLGGWLNLYTHEIKKSTLKSVSRPIVSNNLELSHINSYTRPADKAKDRQETDRSSPRKILLDCGANVASTVLLFRETYPGGRDFTIHSFEIDDRLSPYFSPYDKHHLHCPVGVAGKDGNMTAFSEMVWGPNKGKNHGRDMQWGGGSLFVSQKELKDNVTGGFRKLSYRKTIPVVDLSKWIIDNFSVDDYVILKLDVEGAEFDILRKMIDDKAFAYIDKYYGEYHDGQPTGWTKEGQNKIRADIKKAGFTMVDWVGEKRTYSDIDKMNPIKVPSDTPGKPGEIYSSCESGSVALTVAIGMNFKRAHRVVATLVAHKPLVPTTLFVYGDFVQVFPETVKSWAQHFNIAIREDGYNPPGHLELMPGHWVRMGLISSILRLEEIGITTSYYLPSVVRDIIPTIKAEAAARGLRIIKPVVEFPAKNGSVGQLTVDNYYKYRDVERVPKALRRIHDALIKNEGGVLTLDTDLPDTYMNSVFMMDYLVETSGFKLVPLNECVAKSR
ncbi:uncharacterized protein LOC119745942 [Patiria miniata]|uniref:Methyltransferase FkbM domain-containing protein n=1 Tax=Patiria miniata TaxID=46514 RepID=A0A914BQK1_PATMI|nr:uncharacterized protein LOC119745942 [Patiria miniata]